MRHEIIKATQKSVDKIELGDKKIEFGSNGVAYTDDDGLAREIKSVHGRVGSGDVVVTSYKDRDRNHRYHFGHSQRFSSAWAEFQARRTDKPKINNATRKGIGV